MIDNKEIMRAYLTTEMEHYFDVNFDMEVSGDDDEVTLKEISKLTDFIGGRIIDTLLEDAHQQDTSVAVLHWLTEVRSTFKDACPNGCLDGFLNRHKFSCPQARVNPDVLSL